jgi:hypothetical protein
VVAADIHIGRPNQGLHRRVRKLIDADNGDTLPAASTARTAKVYAVSRVRVST